MLSQFLMLVFLGLILGVQIWEVSNKEFSFNEPQPYFAVEEDSDGKYLVKEGDCADSSQVIDDIVGKLLLLSGCGS